MVREMTKSPKVAVAALWQNIKRKTIKEMDGLCWRRP